MNCNGFESELRSSIERHETIDPLGLREHAAGCPRCRAVWEQSVLLDRAIAAWKGRVPAVDLADGVVARWAFEGDFDSDVESGERLVSAPAARLRPAGGNGRESAAVSTASTGSSHSAARRLDRRIVVAAAMAVLAVVLTPLLWRPIAGPRTSSGNLAHEASPRGAASADRAVANRPVRLDSAMREAGTAWMGLASEATGTVREMAAFLPERTLAVAIETPADRMLPRPTEWTERLREEIHPIRRDVGKAMDFLLEAVPVSRGRTL